MLRVIVLGAAAGGGLPQWNCGCSNCNAARDGKIPKATQTSLAISADNKNWYLINAAPDLREQISATPCLHPCGSSRHSPIRGVILTNAEIDAVTGLLSLRESTPFTIYATAEVLEVIRTNAIFGALNKDFVTRSPIAVDETFSLPGFDVTAFSVPGKEALYLEGSDTDDGATLGLTIRDSAQGKVVHVVTACAKIDSHLTQRLQNADAIFFDGTLWRDDELIALGLGQKTGQRMGHIAMEGETGSIAQLQNVMARRKIFVHINNTNTVWQPSPERAKAERDGWEIGFDGMEVLA